MANPLYDTLFGRHADNDTPFLYLPDGTTITYRAFVERAAKFASVLAGLGVKPGDRVAVQIVKSPDALAIYAACLQAGFVFLPLNTAYKPNEVSYFIEDSGATVFVCDPANAANLAQVAKNAKAKLETLGANSDGSLAGLTKNADARFPAADRNANDLAALLYTSGTTGRSKGAMLTQSNLLSNAETLVDYWHVTESDVLLHALPIFHTHGLFVATNTMALAGGAMIFLPKFDQKEIIRLLPKATTLMGVPTFYTRLLDDPNFTRDLVRHMRLFISGSAPLLAETHRQFEDRTGHRILERYGMTETNMNTSNPYDGDRRAGTVGIPLPGIELKVTDPETGKILSGGNIGLIEIRGPNVFQGYWNMPEKTREELREDGFFITGDIGFLGDDGYVTIVGRNKDMIISGGYNIYPKEIELLLDAETGVLESAVVGAPHPDFGESPVAVIVPQDGCVPDLEAISASLAAKLANFKCPRKYFILPELPRNTMGKVQKNVLRDQFATVFLAN
ncbi:MAG: malonyl-CoA synthase [Paracoccaceae bacterium]|nr:malonyl-CoA synthase [Paracoccaceae bacterium]